MNARTGGALAAVLLAGALIRGGAALADALQHSRGSASVSTAIMQTTRSPRSVMNGCGPAMMSSQADPMVGGAGTTNPMAGASSMGGMMGQTGGMMTCGMAGFMQSTNPAVARTMAQQAASTATVDRQATTVACHSDDVTIVALASPEGSRDMSWNVAGLVNPTVIVPRGARVSVDFFNADVDTMHGWELTGAPPPYPYMAMMGAPVAFPGAFAMPVPNVTAQRWLGHVSHFTAARPGMYYYLCPVPGHAQKGMYGKLVVR